MSKALISKAVQDALPPNFVVRFLSERFLTTLEYLTTVGPITKTDFMSRLNYMKKRNDEYYTIVIEDTRKKLIVGAGTLLVERKFIHYNGLVGHIEDIVTHSGYRGMNLGLRVIETLKYIGKATGCYKSTAFLLMKVVLDCSLKNIPFYQKCGFNQKEVEMVMYMRENDASEKAKFYNLVSKALELLQHQLNQANLDLVKLQKLKLFALENPAKYIESILENVLSELIQSNDSAPKLQKVIAIPFIPKYGTFDQTKVRAFPRVLPGSVFLNNENHIPAYLSSIDQSVAKALLSHKSTLISSQASPTTTPFTTAPTSPTSIMDDETNASRQKSSLRLHKPDDPQSKGETPASSPRKHMKTWSKEEVVYTIITQTLLEQLAQRFKHIPVKAEQIRKIAELMPSRNPRQVEARLRKLEIAKAESEGVVLMNRKRVTGNAYIHQPIIAQQRKRVSDSDEEQVDQELKGTKEYKELKRLKKLVKKKREGREEVVAEHLGFKCDSCHVEPIVGTRYSCIQCNDDNEVDLCETCYLGGFTTLTHGKDHAFDMYDTIQEYWNPDV